MDHALKQEHTGSTGDVETRILPLTVEEMLVGDERSERDIQTRVEGEPRYQDCS